MKYDFTELENENILLRKIKIEDVNNIFYTITNSKEVTKYIPWSRHEDIDQTFKLVEKWQKQYNEGMNYRWIIIEKNIDIPIGIIYAEDLDLENRIINLKYVISNQYSNKKMIIESFEMVIDYLFMKESFLIIKLNHNINNKEIEGIMQKINMTFEGIEKDILINKFNKSFDLARYSINKKQWLSRNCIKYK